MRSTVVGGHERPKRETDADGLCLGPYTAPCGEVLGDEYHWGCGGAFDEVPGPLLMSSARLERSNRVGWELP